MPTGFLVFGAHLLVSIKYMPTGIICDKWVLIIDASSVEEKILWTGCFFWQILL